MSGKAQAIWPGSLVTQRVNDDGSELWILTRPGLPDLGLGDSYKHAKMAFDALRRAEKKP